MNRIPDLAAHYAAQTALGPDWARDDTDWLVERLEAADPELRRRRDEQQRDERGAA